jgi:NAD(P)-dependent dehydrogenase (short-subunit alcohol dehydrogenase family)
MTAHGQTEQHPKQSGAQLPFPQQQQAPPGSEESMEPRADHGEQTYRGSQRLAGKAAIITGGDSGIGRAIAIAFAREGANVLISYLNEDEDAQKTCRLIEESGGKAVALAGDISNEAQCQKIIEQAVQSFGKIDVLINNAAFQRTHSHIQDVASDEFDYTFRTNVYAMFYLCKAALPHMQPGSSIINTASIQAYQPSAQLLPYATTKGAIVTFTKALATEAIQHGVRVNCVAPGPVWTPLIPSTVPPEKAAEFGKQTPMGRPAQPAELAPTYVFLASSESNYIVGEVIGVTGGEFLS